MKQLLLFAVIGIGLAGAGMAFANNGILLTVQSLGVSNDQALTSDIASAHVDFTLAVQPGVDPVTGKAIQFNVITACTVQPDPAVIGPPAIPAEIIPKGDTVYCKLTNANAQVVAEGNAVAATDISTDCANDPNAVANGCAASIPVSITILADPKATPFPDNDVQVVKDVKIVVKGASQLK
jgi:hypothetical protein